VLQAFFAIGVGVVVFNTVVAKTTNIMNTILLCLLWIFWCALHSLLIDPFVTNSVKRQFPHWFRYYRLFYNGFSLLTITPLVVITHMTRGPVVFSWDGYAVIWRGLLLVSALSFFKAGANHYDLHHFIGIRQLKTGEAHTLLSDSEDFIAYGVFGITRHPWYLGSILLVWSMLQNYGFVEILVAAILSGYLVVGTLLEERKILAEYGESYRSYQQKVSILIPWKWFWGKMVSIQRTR
jgi:protein-S-isoprenylcysteine O-methyltransferase Ste14